MSLHQYGFDQVTGCISICKAKPENYGKGRCHHSEHRVMEQLSEEAKRQYNEACLAEYYKDKELSLRKRRAKKEEIPQCTSELIHSSPEGNALSKQEFHDASTKLAEAFPQEDWEVINTFYQKYSTRLSDMKIAKNYDSAQENVQAFLESDDLTARKVREFLGPEVAPADFSALLVNHVKSMRSPFTWKNNRRRDSMIRIMMTSVDNDMTKQRYVASVLFFGGRCCYCNCVLKKEPGQQQATGEHLTPISPDDPNSPVGATRYGNMALACHACNTSRGNKNLEEWLKDAPTVREANREASLARLKAFREFALYKDYTPEQSQKLRQRIKQLDRDAKKKTDPTTHKLSTEDNHAMVKELKIALHDLRTFLRQTE